MMRKLLLYLLLLLFAITHYGCKKSALCDCFKGTGDEITEERPASPFHYLELYNNVDVVVHRNSNYRITVTAGEKLIDKVTTEINNGILEIRNKNKCNWVRSFKNAFTVHIYTPQLDTLEVFDSSGNITFQDTIYSDRFQFESWSSSGEYRLLLNCETILLALQTGPANLVAVGEAGVAYMWNSGFGKFDALALATDDIYNTNKGTNDQYIYAKHRLEAVLKYTGNIYYKGNPVQLKLEDYSEGSFIQLN